MSDFKNTFGTEYSFLDEREELGDNIQLLCYSGSVSYGTNIATSDTDIRGFATDTPDAILLGTTFGTYTNSETDTSIHAFCKFLDLLAKSNPGVFEILGTRKQDILFCSDIAQKIFDNKDLFLSKMAADTFGGYATQQLFRIKNNLARFSDDYEFQQECLLNSIQRAVAAMQGHYASYTEDLMQFHLREDKITCDLRANDVPLGELASMANDASNVAKNYNDLCARNRKKDKPHLCKHMMHLIRLYHMGTEILRDGEVNTYRVTDHDLLMSIRNGAYMDGDDIKDSFWELVDEERGAFNEAKEMSKLPARAQVDMINLLKKDVNAEIVRKYGRY